MQVTIVTSLLTATEINGSSQIRGAKDLVLEEDWPLDCAAHFSSPFGIVAVGAGSAAGVPVAAGVAAFSGSAGFAVSAGLLVAGAASVAFDAVFVAPFMAAFIAVFLVLAFFAAGAEVDWTSAASESAPRSSDDSPFSVAGGAGRLPTDGRTSCA